MRKQLLTDMSGVRFSGRASHPDDAAFIAGVILLSEFNWYLVADFCMAAVSVLDRLRSGYADRLELKETGTTP